MKITLRWWRILEWFSGFRRWRLGGQRCWAAVCTREDVLGQRTPPRPDGIEIYLGPLTVRIPARPDGPKVRIPGRARWR